ncbi:DUF6422 family protein [Mesorhizobium sp. M0601]|uniref:DUF6422 family protein n=1 Tax=Mesorhizobium sp. M0601 TaxID=2956969 RepID=UPI00333754A0
MFKYPSREGLTREQSEALEKAAFLIISARKEAAALLARAGVTLPDDGFGFGNPCNAHIEAHGNCPCNDYTGDGGPCLTQTTLDTAFPPSRSCGHPPSKHLST